MCLFTVKFFLKAGNSNLVPVWTLENEDLMTHDYSLRPGCNSISLDNEVILCLSKHCLWFAGWAGRRRTRMRRWRGRGRWSSSRAPSWGAPATARGSGGWRSTCRCFNGQRFQIYFWQRTFKFIYDSEHANLFMTEKFILQVKCEGWSKENIFFVYMRLRLSFILLRISHCER